MVLTAEFSAIVAEANRLKSCSLACSCGTAAEKALAAGVSPVDAMTGKLNTRERYKNRKIRCFSCRSIFPINISLSSLKVFLSQAFKKKIEEYQPLWSIIYHYENSLSLLHDLRKCHQKIDVSSQGYLLNRIIKAKLGTKIEPKIAKPIFMLYIHLEKNDRET
jgi:hypothetical protein